MTVFRHPSDNFFSTSVQKASSGKNPTINIFFLMLSIFTKFMTEKAHDFSHGMIGHTKQKYV